jgi:predicted RNA-binding Zn ribbon-like protein
MKRKLERKFERDSEKAERAAAPVLAGHPALDLLNTKFRQGDQLIDALQSDEDVEQWLERAGWAIEPGAVRLRTGRLLQAARSLREAIREVLQEIGERKPAELATLNRFLALSQHSLRLRLRPRGGIALKEEWVRTSPEKILGPIAEAAARLIADGDMSLVRRCEGDDCVLWFYDQTRSHRRRWCSVTTCGNRHKVHAYRDRQRGSLARRK